jgi:(S)-ureidoglycine-glyoxylate aminotransferase
MGSGPSNPEPRVLQAMAAAPVTIDDPACRVLFEQIVTLGKEVFRAGDSSVVSIAGASRAGIEAGLASLLEPGERVLVGACGHFGELLCTLAAKHGAVVERVDASWGSAVDVHAMVNRIRVTRPRVVAIVHADTSTGVLQPLEDIGRACRQAGGLFLVDTVLSLGGCQVDVDQAQVDVAIAGLQKCLGGPPGQALVTISPRASEALRGRSTSPTSAYLDLRTFEARWSGQDVDSGEIFGPMLFAVREALALVLDEGLTERWDRHRRASTSLRAGLAAMGLELYADPSVRVPMITLARVPPGIDEASVRSRLLLDHGIEIMSAFGPLRGKVWRIGTMGLNASLPSVLTLLGALEAVLAGCGWSFERGSAVDAALVAARDARVSWPRPARCQGRR